MLILICFLEAFLLQIFPTLLMDLFSKALQQFATFVHQDNRYAKYKSCLPTCFRKGLLSQHSKQLRYLHNLHAA